MVRRLPVLSFIDPGTRRMGWCCGTGAQLPRASAWRFPFTGESLGQMLDAMERALQNHIDAYRPDCLGYERPILTKWDKLQPIRKTYSLGGMIEFVAFRRGIECVEVDLRTIKSELTGEHNASKADMVKAALRLGVVLPLTDADGREDAADAFGGFLVLLRLRSPATFSRYDALLRGQREHILI